MKLLSFAQHVVSICILLNYSDHFVVTDLSQPLISFAIANNIMISSVFTDLVTSSFCFHFVNKMIKMKQQCYDQSGDIIILLSFCKQNDQNEIAML